MWKIFRRRDTTPDSSASVESVSAADRERLERFASHFNARQPFTEPERADVRLWQTGALVPWFITHLLDARRLIGPEVDVACKAQEPAVDLWEAGALYPGWEQTVTLAQLVDVHVRDLGHPDAHPRNHDNGCCANDHV